MTNSILARNVLIHNQLKEIGDRLSQYRIPFILLKGAALIEAMPDYSAQRQMEDIDIMAHSRHIRKVRETLRIMGYLPAPEDPCALRHPCMPAYVDMIDRLWYLNKTENETVINDSLSFSLPEVSDFAFHLKPEDFYIHVLAHAGVHHARKETKWLKDLDLILKNWGGEMDKVSIEQKLKSYGFYDAYNVYLSGVANVAGADLAPAQNSSIKSRLLNRFFEINNPLKGHLARFICLPFLKKLPYIASALFPPNEFLKYRYNLKSEKSVWLYKIFRPCLLFAKSILLLRIIIKNIMYKPENRD